MVYCVAYGCKNGSASGKSFFSFPCKEKEPARWRQWVRMVNRKNWTPSHHAKLCQDHFEHSCFVSDPTVLDSVGFKPGRLRLKKPSAVDRIVPTIFPRVELRTDLSLQRTGSTPLKPSLAITKRTNLKLLEESAAYDTVPTFVEELVIQPTPDDDCQDSRADSFQSMSVQTLVLVQKGKNHVDQKSTEMELPKMNDHLGEVVHTNPECDLIRSQEDDDDEIVSIFEVEPDFENNETGNSKVENNVYLDVENKVLHTVLLKDRNKFVLGTPSFAGNHAALVFDSSVAFNKHPVVMNIKHKSSCLGENKCKNSRILEKNRSHRITVQKNMEKFIEESIQYKSFHMHPHQKNLLAFKTKELRNHVLKLKWDLQHFREDLVCNQTSLQQTIKQTDKRLRPRSRVVYC